MATSGRRFREWIGSRASIPRLKRGWNLQRRIRKAIFAAWKWTRRIRIACGGPAICRDTSGMSKFYNGKGVPGEIGTRREIPRLAEGRSLRDDTAKKKRRGVIRGVWNFRRRDGGLKSAAT